MRTVFPDSSRKVRSGGICWSRCCSIPTLARPGGRWLAGGAMVPPPCMPWPQAEAASRRTNVPKKPEFDNFAVLNTVSSSPAISELSLRLSCTLPSRFGLRLRCAGGLRWIRILRTHWQPALRHNLHRPLDRNVNHTGFLIYPAIAVQFFLLVQAEPVQLGSLVYFQPRLGELQRIPPGRFSRSGIISARQRVLRRLMSFLIIVQGAVHPAQDEVDHHSEYREAQQKAENPRRTQIFLFEFRVFRAFLLLDSFVIHVPVPESPANAGRAGAAAATLSDCGRNTPTTSLRSRLGRRCPTQLHGAADGKSAQSSRTDPPAA